MSLMEQVRSHLRKADDHTIRAVPESERRGGWDLWFVGVAIFFVINTLWNGGLVAGSLTWPQLVLVALLGALVNGVVAATIAYISSKQGTNLTLLLRYSFGGTGFLLPTLLLALIIIGFAALGVGIGSLFGTQLTPIQSRLGWMIFLTLCVGLSSTFGILGILRLSRIAVPLIVIGVLTSFVIAIGKVGGLDGLMALKGAKSMPIGSAVSLVIGQWITGVLIYTADVFRYAKTPRLGSTAAFWAVVVGQPLFTVIGGTLVLAYGINSFANMGTTFAIQGIALFGWLTLFLSFWTTVDNSVYSGTTALGNAFVVHRLYWEPVVLILALLGASMGIADRFFSPFLGIITATVPPLFGIIVADYLLIAKGKYPSPAHVVSLKRRFSAPDGVSLPAFKWSGLIAWLAGFIWIVYLKRWVPALEGIVVAGIVHYVVATLVPQEIRVTDPEKFRLSQDLEAKKEAAV